MDLNNPFLPDLSIHCYKVKIKAKTPFLIPSFPGSMLRGTFGVALKRVVCLNRKQVCSDCLVRKTCIYHFLFETETQNPIKGITNPPHPLILYPLDLGGKNMKRNSIYQFGFTIFGKAIDYLPYVIYAIIKMGYLGIGKGKGKFDLKEVRKYTSEKHTKQVFNQYEKKLISLQSSLTLKNIFKNKCKGEKLIFETITPLRLKIRGKLRDHITLKDIVFAISHRLKILSFLYGEGEIDLLKNLDLNEILKGIKTASQFEWTDFKRFSKRQDTHLHIGGVMGKMTITGNLSKIYPLLKLGQYIHIGKNTAFGLGRYKVVA